MKKNRYSMRLAAVALGAFGVVANVLSAEIVLTLDGPTRLSAPTIMRSASVGEAGDTVKVVVKNVNPMLYDVVIEADYRQVNTLPTGANPFAPQTPAAPENTPTPDTFIGTPALLSRKFLKEDSTFAGTGGSYPELDKALIDIIFVNTGVELKEGILTKEAIDKQVAAFTLQKPDKKADLERAGELIWQIFSTWRTAKLGVMATYQMVARNELSIKVTVTPRQYLAVWNGKNWQELSAVDLRLKGLALSEERAFNTLVPLKDATAINWTFAVFFSDARAKSYALQGENPNRSIVEKGDRDDASVYVGTLYNFALDDRRQKTFFSIGVGTNASKMLYFAGFTFRLGSQNAPGFISIGASINQVEGLDGVKVGSFSGDKIPMKSVYKIGLGVALSFRF